ncbi:MAG: hypothetical protein AB7S78_13645 [Candidatus Omnitrophota bacterium]
MLSGETKMMCGVILLTMVSIEYGGYFLLSLWQGKHQNLQLTPFQKNFFKAGHAHAGVLVMLALIAQILTDATGYSAPLRWSVRLAFPLAAMLISGGFFASAIGKNIEKPNKLAVLIMIGAGVLTYGLMVLGIGLLL